MSDQPAAAPPTLVSLLICDQVIDDKLSNKKSAIGLFSVIVVPQMPAAIHQMAVLASLTEISGKTQVELRLMRDADNSPIFTSQGYVNAPNPLAVVDLLFHLRGIRIQAAGQYAFEVLHKAELLGRRRFQLVVRTPPRPPQSPPQRN